eukprot:103030-Amphidinium_carterae.1
MGTDVLEDLFARWVGKPDNILWKPTPFLRAQVLDACSAAREHGLPKRQAPHAPLSERSDVASERKVKMAHVVSQQSDEEVELVSEDVVSCGLTRYKRLFGCFPPEDQDPSHAQLTCLHALLETGRVPYVDFAIWVPFSQRMLKKAKLDILVFSTSGLKPTELPGPSNFDAWDSSYNVFKSAM